MVAQPGDDEAPAARGRRVLPVPARAQGECALKALIVTADDFGIAPEVNAAVELAHTRGILTAASLMVNGAAVDDAVERARRLPSLRVGLHLVLVDGGIFSFAEGYAASSRPRSRRSLPGLRANRSAAGPRQCPPSLPPASVRSPANPRHRAPLRHARVARPAEPAGYLNRIESWPVRRRDWLAARGPRISGRRVRRRSLRARTRSSASHGPAR